MYSLHPLEIKKGPVAVSVQKVLSYPFHWDDCVEIILVLEGSITMQRGIWTRLIPHVMEKQDIFAVTMNELHCIYDNEGQDNLILMLQIDGDFVRKNFPSAPVLEFDYFFKSDYFFIKDEIEQQKIEHLKQLAVYLASTIVNQTKYDFTDIEKNTKELLFYLIDNFNRINATLKRTNDEKYISRIMRITDYLINNIEQKNLLQEISEREYFNPKYISHIFKKGWFLSIQELTNIYRVIRASKMLLETDKNISDIAYECGFSASRYFYKHFKSFYPPGPLYFRKNFQEGFRNIRYLKCYEEKIESAKNYLQSDINKKLGGQDVKWLETDAHAKGQYSPLSWNDYINVKANDLANARIKDYVELVQRKFGFQYMRIIDLLPAAILKISSDTAANERIQDWFCDAASVLRFVRQTGSKPVIRLKTPAHNRELYHERIRLFLKYCEKEFCKKTMKNWAFELENSETQNKLTDIVAEYSSNIFYKTDIKLKLPAKSLSHTIYMASYIVKEAALNRNIDFFQPVGGQNAKGRHLRSNCCSLIATNGLLHPSFHACSLLSYLGEEIIERGDCYLITGKKDSLQILLFNHIDNNTVKNEDDLNNFLYNNNYIKKISVHIKNINGICKMNRYELNNENGSVYDHFGELGYPCLLNSCDIDLLNRIYSPKLSFDCIKEADLTLNVNLLPYSIELITLDFVTL